MSNIRYDAKWEGGGYYALKCLECREMFSVKRRDAQYCSPLCRKRANRRKNQIKSDAEQVVRIIHDLERLNKERSDLWSETSTALRMIRAAVGNRDAQRGTDSFLDR